MNQLAFCVVFCFAAGCDLATADPGTQPESEARTPDRENNRQTALAAAPAALREILAKRRPQIEFRKVAHVPEDFFSGGCYWRVPLSEDLVKAHIDRFKLKSTSPGTRTKKLLRYYPQDWPDLSSKQLQWYAWPGNRDDGNLQLWSVMAIDRKNAVIYFYWQNYDVTP